MSRMLSCFVEVLNGDRMARRQKHVTAVLEQEAFMGTTKKPARPPVSSARGDRSLQGW